jgi:L-Ala-D/L-Glu epimerase / N-acetyl-D-glutamate racemase
MDIQFRSVQLTKRYPLAISRGVSSGSVNLLVFVSDGEHTGVGEMSPGELTGAATAEIGQQWLEKLIATGLDGKSPHEIWRIGREIGVPPCAHAALDMALWDLLAKQAGMPLYRLLGLGKPTTPTSITIGINPPDIAAERVTEMLARTGARSLKIKLGSPEGADADRAMYAAVAEAAGPFGVTLRVDANGGWDLPTARAILVWLAQRGADYVEQPLAEGAEDQLPDLFADRPLPIFVDESCRFSADIPRWAHAVDGVNAKLMKCGGTTEAVRIVATARAHGLKTMIGCMGESSIAISAGAAIGALFDHIDLDSNLNLAPDPGVGARLVDGVVTPPDAPGHGAALVEPGVEADHGPGPGRRSDGIDRGMV